VVPASAAGINPLFFKFLPMGNAKCLKALRKANSPGRQKQAKVMA